MAGAARAMAAPTVTLVPRGCGYNQPSTTQDTPNSNSPRKTVNHGAALPAPTATAELERADDAQLRRANHPRASMATSASPVASRPDADPAPAS
jgi:hypothetical protein